MPMDIIPKALYPLVPNAPGVPTLLRNAATIADVLTGGYLGISDALNNLIGADPVQWGVFDDAGNPIALSDSVISVDYRNGSRISDYPVEQGAFASYNKVANPYDAKVRLACGGTEDSRADFLDALEVATASLNLYTIVTPERTYLNANIESMDYKRESMNGAYMIVVDLYLREIRETATAAFSAAQEPSGADPQSQGQVQTFAVTSPSVTVTSIQ